MRYFSLFLLFVAFPVLGQQPQESREVLKALPLDFEETAPPIRIPPPVSGPLLEPTLITPAVNAPAIQNTSIPTVPSDEVSPLNTKPIGDDAARLQIFLDQSNFGPGVIDGKIGEFSELAVKSWNEVNGHPLDDWAAANTAARDSVPNPFAVALVPEIAKDWVNSELSQNRIEQSKVKRMAYRSIAEFMSERYHTDIPTLTRLNPGISIYGLQPQNSIIVPNIRPFLIENLSDRAYNALEDLSDRYVVVDTSINQIRIFAGAPKPNIITDPDAPLPPRANTALLASFPITPGKPEFVKLGTWKLHNMVEFPWWRYDQQLLDTGKRSENAYMIPPGPNSPVGIIWCGTTRSGIGLHGTSDPETIGRSRSAGCIRLCNWDAIRLPTLVRPGATIEIR
jgi:lipoprotein-anchoring transpeptidase ErfK/SrfK